MKLFGLILLFTLLTHSLGSTIPNKDQTIDANLLQGRTENNEDNEDDFNYDGRIVGGMPTTISNFPYQVSLQQNNAHICGGSIVEPNIIITAAHCVMDTSNPSAFKVRVGSSQHKFGGQLIAVRRIIRHEKYSMTTLDNDIAILLLANNLVYSPNVQPVALAEPDDTLRANVRLFVSGWGLTSEDGNLASMLNYVVVRLINQNTCALNYKPITQITSNMFCAGFPNGGKDSCQGDSGGPLVSYIDGVPKLHGIVSFGIGCAQRGYPGVYAKVAALRSWIDGNILDLKSG